MSTAILRGAPLFAGLGDADLAELERNAQRVRLEAGAVLFQEGDPGDHAYVLLEGELEVLKGSAGRPVLLAVRSRPGDLIGEMALLEQAPRMATVRARSVSVLLAIAQRVFDTLLASSPGAARAMFRTVVRRWRETEAMLHQSEKMVQLGTLTAGVAHELNNPASAVRRSVVRMAEALAVYVRSPWPKAVADAGLRERMLERALDASTHPKVMDSLARSDLESQLTEGLRIAGVRDGSILAGALVGMGYDTAQIAKLGAEVGGRELEAVVSWLSATYTLQVLAREAGEAAGRIAEIVKALGAYTYLDRAPLQTVDVREGLENTLLILGHKLGGIQVLREYDPGLPSIQAYGNELNQVWTNILDNAADALGGSGCIRIRARPEADTIVVEIADDGPGVPPEARERVFDAFYTTKPPGRGTGLGLHISYNIVVARHGGDIRLESRPGNTCFRIRLPVLGPH